MHFFKRLFEYILVFFIIVSLNFLIPRLMPGDPFTFLSSDEGSVHSSYTDEQIAKYKSYYGLDKPLSQQYRDYMINLFRGNLGYSIYFNDTVVSIISKRVVWTIGIVAVSIVISSILGVFLGAFSAWHRNNRIDNIIYSIMITFSEIPSFLIAMLLLFVLAAGTGLFPLSGGITVFGQYDSSFQRIMDIIHHGFLPVLALVLSQTGGYYLLSRNSMITVLSKDYMLTAEAKGLEDRRIIFRHGLKNAILPVVTRIFMNLGTVFGGAILVENVFNYPGVGRLMRQAVMVRDYVLIQGIFLNVCILVLTMNFLADIVYRKLDPRVN
jgi:peptide/nickel transport system permease protein